MLVGRIARQAALHFDRLGAIGEDRDAVEAFLAMPDRVVADASELGGGETLVLALDLLKASDGGAGFLEPFEQPRQARLDPVDVERGDSHGFIR